MKIFSHICPRFFNSWEASGLFCEHHDYPARYQAATFLNPVLERKLCPCGAPKAELVAWHLFRSRKIVEIGSFVNIVSRDDPTKWQAATFLNPVSERKLCPCGVPKAELVAWHLFRSRKASKSDYLKSPQIVTNVHKTNSCCWKIVDIRVRISSYTCVHGFSSLLRSTWCALDRSNRVSTIFHACLWDLCWGFACF